MALTFSLLRRFVNRKLILSNKNIRLASTDSLRAARLHEFGKKLQIDTLGDIGRLRDGQVKIKVNYCSLNRSDVEIMDGEIRNNLKLPFIPGYELSGEVIEIRPTTNEKPKLEVGDQVVALSHVHLGGLASQVIVDDSDVWKIPTELDLKDAAVLLLGHATALLTFSTCNPIDETNTVLVSAGVGGRGLAAVDVAANLYKAKVIGLYDTEGQGSLLREIGCFQAYNASKKNVVKEVLTASGDGVNLAYNAISTALWQTMRDCLKDKDNGKIFEANPHYWKEFELPPNNADNSNKEENKKKKNDQNSAAKIKDLQKYVTPVDLFQTKKSDAKLYDTIVKNTLQFASEELISPHISKEFTLEQVNDAIEFIRSKQCTGKIIVRIEDL